MDSIVGPLILLQVTLWSNFLLVYGFMQWCWKREEVWGHRASRVGVGTYASKLIISNNFYLSNEDGSVMHATGLLM